MIRRTQFATILLAMIAMSRGALAGDAALAETLFRQGRELMDKGDYVTACPRLAESYAQDPATGTLLALGLCQEQAGQTASAWATYAEVVARAKRDGRTDREQAARERVEALEPKLSHLTIDVDAFTASIAGVIVKRDTVVVGRGAWGASSPVDPGEHFVEATAPGKLAWRGAVTVGPVQDAQTLRVPALVDEPPKPIAEAPQAAPPFTPPPPPPRRGPPLQTVGLVVGGVGVVGLGLSAYFGLHAANLNSDSKSNGHCAVNNECDPEGFAKRNDAASASNVATVALVAGGLLTAAGVTLFVVGSQTATKVEAAPVVGPGAAAMLLRARF